MSIRQFYVDEALQSYHRQRKVLTRLTEEECLHALRLEAATRRRRSIILRLVQRIVHLRERAFNDSLRKEFLDAP